MLVLKCYLTCLRALQYLEQTLRAYLGTRKDLSHKLAESENLIMASLEDWKIKSLSLVDSSVSEKLANDHCVHCLEFASELATA